MSPLEAFRVLLAFVQGGFQGDIWEVAIALGELVKWFASEFKGEEKVYASVACVSMSDVESALKAQISNMENDYSEFEAKAIPIPWQIIIPILAGELKKALDKFFSRK